jgi:hypothetical protein
MERNTKIHLPISDKGRKVKIETNLPVLFLAGPIRNAPKWQEEAIELLLEKNESIFVASPTRTIKPSLMSYVETDKPEYEVFERQRAWEQYYLSSASQKGCIIFWLPKEVQPKEVEEKVYAHITMLELGEWIARKKNNQNIKIVIGTDGQFPEWSTIEYEIKIELPDLQIKTSLKETIDTALSFI